MTTRRDPGRSIEGPAQEARGRHGRVLCECGWSLVVGQELDAAGGQVALQVHVEQHTREGTARAWDRLLPGGPGEFYPAEG